MSKTTKVLIIIGCIAIFLLIVAAIIVPILLGTGVIITSNNDEVIETAVDDMTNQATQIFNKQFEGYQGTQSANNVKSLISMIIISNNQEGQTNKVNITYTDNQGMSVMAKISDANFERTAKSISNWIKESKIYKVSLQYSDGVIANAVIETN